MVVGKKGDGLLFWMMCCIFEEGSSGFRCMRVGVERVDVDKVVDEIAVA